MEPRRRALTATDANQPPRALPYDPTYPRKPLPNAPKKRTSTEAGLELPPIRNLDRSASYTSVPLPSVSKLPSIRPSPPVPNTVPIPPILRPVPEAPLHQQPQQQRPGGPKRGHQSKPTPSNPTSIQFVLSTAGGDAPQAPRTAAAGGVSSSGSKPRSSLMSVPPILDVSAISLAGEDTSSVPVFDTCDVVRTKIKRMLARDGVTQAAFLREIGKTYPEPRKIQSKSLNDFLAKKGPSAGNTSCIYYAGYVFFEKVRIRDGKPKSADRLEMERLWPDGCNTTDIRSRVYVQAGEKAYEDKYGRLHIVGRK